MKGMRFLPIFVIGLAFLGIGAANFSPYSQDERDEGAGGMAVVAEDTCSSEDDEYSFSWEEPPVPDFLANYMDSADWGIDTICVVNGKAYYFGYEQHGRTGVVYTLDELLCEDPVLGYDSVDSKLKTTFSISTSYKSMTVDFADKKSVKKLKTFIPKSGNTKRFTKDYFSDIGNIVLFHLDIDYPKNNSTSDDNVREWLVQLVNESLDFDVDVPELSAEYIGYEKQNHSDWKYRGNIKDIDAIGKFASEKYFALQKMNFGDDKMNYPHALFYDLSLRQICSNGKYVSYQQYTHYYGGGAHGMPTENIESFDMVNKEVIDWEYLFKSDCEKEVVYLLFHVAQKDSRYRKWERTESIAAIKEHFEQCIEGRRNGQIVLPKPGLTDKGVVFSFQPYAIGCFAEGVYHFTIPYKDLKPYMSERAKRLLNL